MARPAQRRRPAEEPPAYDAEAIEKAYRQHRARRHARIERRRASRLARLRFWGVLGALFLVCLVIAVTIWVEVQRLFGL